MPVGTREAIGSARLSDPRNDAGGRRETPRAQHPVGTLDKPAKFEGE